MTKRSITATGAISAAIIALLIFMSFYAPARTPHPVPILMYHEVGSTTDSAWCVPIEIFRSQMRSLREQGYTAILPSDIAARRKWGKPLPRKPVIITFDDGYLCNLAVVEPILKDNGLRAVIYLITGKTAETEASRREHEEKKCLAWPEISAMQTRRTFIFGGHSHSHVNLAASGDPLPDILECRKQLQRHGIRRPYSFCYPFGQYKPETIKAVKQAGFQTAVVCEDAVATIGPSANLFALPRVSVMGGSHDFKFLNKERDQKANAMIYRLAHAGIPIEISACLRGNGNKSDPENGASLAEADPGSTSPATTQAGARQDGKFSGQNLWLPAQEISRGEFELRFVLPENRSGHEDGNLEIWDKHRLFNLATIK